MAQPLPINGGGGPPGNDDLGARIGRLEVRVATIEGEILLIKIDLGVIKATCATKTDIAELKAAIAEGKSAILMWVVGAVFLSELIPEFIRLLQSWY